MSFLIIFLGFNGLKYELSKKKYFEADTDTDFSFNAFAYKVNCFSTNLITSIQIYLCRNLI